MANVDLSAARRVAAKDLVKEIAREHGCLPEEVLARMSPEDRCQVEAALLKKDELIGPSVITLAKNLYSSNARFVFELLQIADDNHYTKARARGAVPEVTFHVRPNIVQLENNEDGFSPANLRQFAVSGRALK